MRLSAFLLIYLLILPVVSNIVVDVPIVVSNYLSNVGHYVLMELNATDITNALNDAANILFTAVKLSMYMVPLVLVYRVYSRLWR